MKIKGIIILLFIFWGSILQCSAQKAAVKTNLFYGIYSSSPNIEAEFGLSPRSTIELGGGFNLFTSGKSSANKKLVHWLGSAEYRYWTCERFNGHFWGIHILGSQYNIAGHHLPLLFGDDSGQYRYEGWGIGGGISYGYHFLLSNRWSLEANIGMGYARLHYDKFRCETCGERPERKTATTLGRLKLQSHLYFS